MLCYWTVFLRFRCGWATWHQKIPPLCTMAVMRWSGGSSRGSSMDSSNWEFPGSHETCKFPLCDEKCVVSETVPSSRLVWQAAMDTVIWHEQPNIGAKPSVSRERAVVAETSIHCWTVAGVTAASSKLIPLTPELWLSFPNHNKWIPTWRVHGCATVIWKAS